MSRMVWVWSRFGFPIGVSPSIDYIGLIEEDAIRACLEEYGCQRCTVSRDFNAAYRRVTVVYSGEYLISYDTTVLDIYSVLLPLLEKKD